MRTVSSYGVELRKQNIPIRQTLDIYRSAVSYLIEIYAQIWDELAVITEPKKRFNTAEHLVHTTKKNQARFDFDLRFPKMPSYLAEEYKFQILAMEVMPDHIHLLVDCRPQFYISDMIKIMKGNIARQMFLAHPELKKELWGGHLWNPSYCAVTVSDRSREQVCSYIEGQKEKQ